MTKEITHDEVQKHVEEAVKKLSGADIKRVMKDGGRLYAGRYNPGKLPYVKLSFGNPDDRIRHESFENDSHNAIAFEKLDPQAGPQKDWPTITYVRQLLLYASESLTHKFMESMDDHE